MLMEQGIRRMNDAMTGTEIVIDGGTARQSEPADRTLDTHGVNKAGYGPRV
jgi:hypothetical protein